MFSKIIKEKWKNSPLRHFKIIIKKSNRRDNENTHTDGKSVCLTQKHGQWPHCEWYSVGCWEC